MSRGHVLVRGDEVQLSRDMVAFYRGLRGVITLVDHHGRVTFHPDDSTNFGDWVGVRPADVTVEIRR